MNQTFTLDQLQTFHPEGMYCANHGCFYYLDYDNELAYHIQTREGLFIDEPEYVDIDTLEDDAKNIVNNVLYAITVK